MNENDSCEVPDGGPILEKTSAEKWRSCPFDERGFPVPWFLFAWEDGKPEFRAMDRQKFLPRGSKKNSAGFCGGENSASNMTFVAGPMLRHKPDISRATVVIGTARITRRGTARFW